MQEITSGRIRRGIVEILPIACSKSNLGVMRPPTASRWFDFKTTAARVWPMQSAVFNSPVKRGLRVPLAAGGLLAA
jgi:hypothetical protein